MPPRPPPFDPVAELAPFLEEAVSVPTGVCPACQGRFMPELDPCSRCGGSGVVPLASIPAAERAEGYYWVRRGDVPEVAFWSVRGCWQFVWSMDDWKAEGIEVLSDRLPPPGDLPPPL